jgi:imidazolonepropionase-like amidohydrolase
MVALVEDSRRLGRYVAAHCHGTPGIHNAIEANVRTIEHCSFMVPNGMKYDERAADRIAEQGIYICPTLGAGARMIDHMQREGIPTPWAASFADRYENLRKMRDLGVNLISGNDAGVPMSGFDDFQLDLELLVEHVGTSNAEAIASATSVAAEAIGSDEFGTLKPGKRADILVVREDALADIAALRNVLIVMKSGNIVVDNAA